MFCNIFHLIVAGVWGAIVCYLSVNAANGHNAPITHNPTPAIITILTMCQYNSVTDLAGLLRMLSHRLGRVVPRHDSWAGLGWAVCRLGLGTVIMRLQLEQSNPRICCYNMLQSQLSSRCLLPTREYLSLSPPSLLTTQLIVLSITQNVVSLIHY